MGHPVALTRPARRARAAPRRRWRGALATLCLAAWLAPLPAPAQADTAPAMAGPPGCRFVVPDGFAATGTRWLGACRAGLAQGRGLLRDYQGGRVVRVFYGRLQAGEPALGVVDLGDGFVAGRFQAGKVLPGAERDTLIQAFDEASAAARQAAVGFTRAGNNASALFYRDKARQLAEQID